MNLNLDQTEAPVAANQPADATKQKLLQAVETFEYSKSSRQVLLDIDVAAVIEAAALVGRTLRVYWPEEDAWFLGTVTSYNIEAGQHHVSYVDGDQLDHIMALERVRIQVTQGAELPKPSPAALSAYCTLLEQRAANLRSAEPEESEELIRRAAELRAGTSVGAPESENRCSLYRPGDVVWAKCRSFPPWPAMVVTRQLVSSLYKKVPTGKFLDSYPIVYFGSNEYEWRLEKDLTSMREGIEQDFHLGKTIKRRLFGASISEVTAYMADGEVPELMFPCNDALESDGEEEDDDEEDDEKCGGKKKALTKNGKPFNEKDGYWSGFTNEPGMPLKVGKTLTVYSLGRVEWLHPFFHDEKSIWPVGYKAERVAVTPAAGSKKPKRHLCEILEATDGSGPIFKITPWGRPSVQGRTPHKAWTALFETPDADNTALVVGNGARHFGLTVTQVASAIIALPGSNRCERFAGWLDGVNPPPPPPLNTEEERKRLAYEAAACRLPDGVIGISAATTKPGTCYVCFEEEEDEEDLILQCDGCGIFTHMACYGVPEPPHGHLWLCDTCKVGATFPPACALCPVLGGALKRTDCGRWVHPSCVMWLPEDTFLNRELSYHNLQGLVTGLSSVHPSRRKLHCQICRMPHGACMQCCEPGCYAPFHIMCARQTEGYALQLLADTDSEEEEEEGVDEAEGGSGRIEDADTAAVPATTIAVDTPDGDDLMGLPSTSGSGDENRPVEANGGAGAGTTTAAGGAGANTDGATTATTNGVVCDGVVDTTKVGKKRGRPGPVPGAKKQEKKLKYKMVRGKRKAFVAEGTKINGARLVVYCPRHCPEGYVQPTIIPALDKVVKTAAVEHQNNISGKQQPATTAAAGAPITATTNIARIQSDNNASGRSSVAEETFTNTPSRIKRSRASLLPKKLIDEAILEKASAAVGGWPAPAPDTIYASRAMPFDGSLGRGPRAPEAMEAALAKRYYIEATPLLVRGPVPDSVDPPKSTCTWHVRGNTVNGSSTIRSTIAPGGVDVGALNGVGVGAGVGVVENAKVLEPEKRKVHQLPGAPTRNGCALGGASEEDDDVEIMGVGATTHQVNNDNEKAKQPLLPQQQQALNPEEEEQPTSIEAVINTALVVVNADTEEEEDIMSKPDTINTTLTSPLTVAAEKTTVITATAPRITADRKTVLSSTDRYREMRATEGLRIAPGKSAIHGWGAFARLPHTKDQMVIEYVGDLVRPSVADARERQVYDNLVGAGTYVFRVNIDQCVDATRSGNLAHLLNHSCEPNCYSRTVPVWDGEKGAAVDHVVIFAAREIATWEELTYDYRFSGEENLVCNCGAGRCRGMVNQASTGPGGGVAVKGTMVPKSKVRYPFRN